MTHYFAKVENGIVTETIVAEQDFINTLPDKELWVETFKEDESGTPPFRKNFGCVGSSYDAAADAFIPKKHFASWVFNSETYRWDAPVPKPTDREYIWSEENLSWMPKLTTDEVFGVAEAEAIAREFI